MSVLILKREEIKKVIDMREVIEEVRKVYKLKSQGKTVIWPLVNYEFEEEHAAMDIRSGYVKGEQLHVKSLDLEKGEAEIEGKVNSVSYLTKNAQKKEEPLLKRMFR